MNDMNLSFSPPDTQDDLDLQSEHDIDLNLFLNDDDEIPPNQEQVPDSVIPFDRDAFNDFIDRLHDEMITRGGRAKERHTDALVSITTLKKTSFG